MKNFNYAKLIQLNKVINREIVGQFINRFMVVSNHDFYFDLSRKNNGLFISLNNSNPFVDIVSTRLSLPKSERESHLATIFRHHIEKGRIISSTVIPGQKILKLIIEKHYENLSIKRYTLFFELIVAHPNLIVIDENQEIVTLFKASKDFSGPRILRISQPYKLPAIATPFTDENTSYEVGTLVENYLEDVIINIKKENHLLLFRHVKAAIKRLSLKKIKIEAELSNLTSPEEANMYGTLLLTYQPEIVTTSLNIDGYTFSVNPELDAVRNATLWFNRAKKSRQTLISKNEQIVSLNAELDYYLALEKSMVDYDDTELKEVEIELGIGAKKRLQKNQIPTFKPYFLVYKGIKIGFGKNNLQNDHLTFKIANKNDTFIHIKGQPGAHIVIFSPEPNEETLSFAAKLGLYLAKIPSATFSFTKKKYIKKGPFPGSVIFENEQTIFQKADEQALNDYVGAIKRF